MPLVRGQDPGAIRLPPRILPATNKRLALQLRWKEEIRYGNTSHS